MDLKNDNISFFIKQKLKEIKSTANVVSPVVKKSSNKYNNLTENCTTVHNGYLTRSKQIEMKLDNIINETFLPRFEQIVEHLRSRQHLHDEIGTDLIDADNMSGSLMPQSRFQNDPDLENISVYSVSSNTNNEMFTIKNYDSLLKDFIYLVSQFIKLMSDQSMNQHIIEKAAVYLLWIFYDSYNMNTLISSHSNMNGLNLQANYSNLEYVFCLDNFNNDIIEKLCFVVRSLFELMDQNFLNSIFYYSSMIKKAASDVEEQNSVDNQDWFDLFQQDLLSKTTTSNEFIDPFDNDSFNFMPVTGDDLRLINEYSTDLSKLNSDYLNSEFLLQHLSNNGSSLPQSEESTTLNNTATTQNGTNFGQDTKNLLHAESNQEMQSTEDAMNKLSLELSTFISIYNSTHDQPFYLNYEELFNTVLNWIIENYNDEDLCNELTNLLGEHSADLITKIITVYKTSIQKSNLNSSSNVIAKTSGQKDTNNKGTSIERTENIWKLVCQAKNGGTSSIAPAVVVHTEKEKVLKKEMRKIEKKYGKFQKIINKDSTENETEKLTLQDLERMREDNLKASIRTAFKSGFDQLKPSKKAESYPYVFDLFQSVKTTASFIAGNKLLLPIGFEKKESKSHDEVIIPLMSSNEETKEFLKKFNTIKISETDEFCRIGFEGFSTLNLIQSTVFGTAYQTENQNMLICAPTGAGKTNIAMLAMLNVLHTFSVDDTVSSIKHDQYKIVYIAPMKALCAEMTSTFGRRLAPFGVKVRELTGDMQLTSKEIMETQMLVVTPEKWDIVTRKSVGDVQLLDLVRLIIIDEVHLLQSDRGHVLETLVARTIRYVERAQKFIRIIGLSATLPNYLDVAQFLHVDLYKGLFVFDERFRPVPLLKTFIGCKATMKSQLNNDMDDITFEKAREILLKEHQVMVFVHSRNATLQLANYLLERSKYTGSGEESLSQIFKADTVRLPGSDKIITRARYRNLNKLLLNGLGVHHAGMPRSERNIVEKLFKAGVIKVLVCTSTLAWGVNLPAHAAIIRGTEYYDPSQGQMVDIDMLDVNQIFGRAGRPQFDTEGEAIIITSHAKLSHYLSMLTNQLPIESRFLKRLTDNLNAEIVLGTVSNISEAVDWLRYTYAYIRMHKNPLEYGLSNYSVYDEGIIQEHLTCLVRNSAELLDRAQMIRYNPDTEGLLDSTHLGRNASHFYIEHNTIVHFNETITSTMDTGHILDMLSKAHEFEQLRIRDDEIEDLTELRSRLWYQVKGDLTNTHTKVNILMQAAISRFRVDCHSLSSDMMYILQNVSRLARGLFEYAIKRGWPLLADNFLTVSLMFEKQFWFFDTPLYQFESELPSDVLSKLSSLSHSNQLGLYDLLEMSPDEIGERIREKKYGHAVKRCARMIPQVEIEASIKPITRTILTVYIDVKPNFIWDDRTHGKTGQIYWLWLTDLEHNHIYHAELSRFTKKQVVKEEVQHYVFTIPLLRASSMKKQYLIHCVFEYWMGTSNEMTVSCEGIHLPDKHLPNTKLLDLMPLPISALQNELYESVFPYTHFNPIQTQIFHTLYHTDHSVLLGAPTGSGKTVAAEIAMFRVFNTKPDAKIVYIAPLKALVRERVDDWKIKIERNMGRRVVELTGDVTPDIGTIASADVIVTTPEKWDGVSRGWPSRSYVRQVALIIIDEIHLLGEERGPVLEVIVSRANFICRRTKDQIRILGLSTAVANAQDLAAWLGIKKVGLYNFSASVRPVPIEVHVSGFAGKHYCPRMASMNKPAYRAIKKYSPEKPTIIFVSSRRQTRLTALDLITLIASDAYSHGVQYLRIGQEELENRLECITDATLKHTLSFGIGMHHAGLRETDRKIVEELFAAQKIQILITTATLAWGVNLPAHAVIIKGTEFFDGKKGRYVDFPITDVLQMIGRAGRPQFDTSAVAILFVHDIKKEYYKKFLYEPFPVESHLLEVFADHLNAEVVSRTVQSNHEAMEYLSSTYLFYRITKNPSYYGVDLSDLPNEHENSGQEFNLKIVEFLSKFIEECVEILVNDYCIRSVSADDFTNCFEEDEMRSSSGNAINQRRLISTPLGKISSYYYLSHSTVRLFQDSLGSFKNPTGEDCTPYLPLSGVLDLLTQAVEYAQLPVRHNEELLNEELSKRCPIKLHRRAMESPHTKANLLIQAHCSRLRLPIIDYYTDLKTVMDQAIRIIQSMIDIAALNESLPTALNIINLQQCIMQASWQNANQLSLLVDVDDFSNEISHNGNDASQYFDDQNRNDSFKADIQRVPPELSLIPYLLNVVHSNSRNAVRNLQNLFSQYDINNSIVNRIHKSLLQLPLIDLEQICLTEAGTDITTTSNSNISDHKLPEKLNEFIISKQEIFKQNKEFNWTNLESDKDYLIRCKFRKKLLVPSNNHKARSSRNQNKAFCPHFPKPKSESWYLVLGMQEKSELVAITRIPVISSSHSTQITLQFRTPSVGKECTSSNGKQQRILYSLYLLSDCYVGLDQQYSLPFNIH